MRQVFNGESVPSNAHVNAAIFTAQGEVSQVFENISLGHLSCFLWDEGAGACARFYTGTMPTGVGAGEPAWTGTSLVNVWEPVFTEETDEQQLDCYGA